MSDDRTLWTVTPVPRDSVTLDGWTWELTDGLVDVQRAPDWMPPGHVILVFDAHHFDPEALGELIPSPLAP